MCAFIPASANWSGATPFRARSSRSGAHARGTADGSCAAASTASKKRPANWTSSAAMNAGSANVTPESRACTASVTARYSRVKHATPSDFASPARICSIRVTATVTVGGEAMARRYAAAGMRERGAAR